MDTPVPAVMMPAEPVVVTVVGAVPAVIGAAEVVEAESKVEGDRRPDIYWRTVGGGRRTVDCATAQRSRQQQRKYQAFRGALCQDLHDRTESNTLTV